SRSTSMVVTPSTNGSRPPGSDAAAPRQVLLESELQAVTLEGGPLAEGASAAIYALPDAAHLVAKVFHKPPEDLSDRLAAMIRNPPLDLATGQRHPSIAWPVERLWAVGTYRVCVGYAMPRVKRARTLVQLCDRDADPAQGPHHGQRLHAARQLASAVYALHSAAHAVGCWDPAHVLVDDEGGLMLVSADTFQIGGVRIFPARG